MRHAVLPLRSDLRSAFRARRFATQFTADRGLDGATGDVCLIADELVTNAILHGAPPVALTLHYDHDGAITIEVTDGEQGIDSGDLGDEPESGRRGLSIVGALAQRWGVRRAPAGKTVWATMHTCGPASQ